jgi:hypothetical protein
MREHDSVHTCATDWKLINTAPFDRDFELAVIDREGEGGSTRQRSGFSKLARHTGGNGSTSRKIALPLAFERARLRLLLGDRPRARVDFRREQPIQPSYILRTVHGDRLVVNSGVGKTTL